MKLEIYYLWDDAQGNRQSNIVNYPNWTNPAPRNGEVIVFGNNQEAFIVEAVRYEMDSNIVSISATLAPGFFSPFASRGILPVKK